MDAHTAVLALAFVHRLALHLRLRDVQRMAHGNQRARLLCGHHARHARARQHVALRRFALDDQRQRVGMHADEALGHGHALRDVLIGHVHHAHVALLVDMRQMLLLSHSCSPKNENRSKSYRFAAYSY